MPRGQAAAEANAAAAAQNPAGAAPAAATPPAASQPSQFSLPTELQGRSAEDVARYYSDRYKDYDSIKERADKYGGYEETKLSPEHVKNLNKWATDLLAGLSSGKRAYLKDNQVVFLDEAGQPSAQPPATQQPEWTADWELLDLNQQRDRMAGHIWNDQLTPKITELVKKYDEEIRSAVNNINSMFGTFMDAHEVWQANPSLNLRDLLSRANNMSRSNPAEWIRDAAREMMSPKEQEQKVNELAAAKFAEMQAKWEAEHQAPALGAPTGGSHRFAQDAPKNKKEARDRFLSNAHTANGKA